jgi:hypothetical protein
MLHMLISPDNIDKSNKEPGSNNMDFEEALSMFTGTEPKLKVTNNRESTRISWPDEKDKKETVTNKDRHRSLDVIIESED